MYDDELHYGEDHIEAGLLNLALVIRTAAVMVMACLAVGVFFLAFTLRSGSQARNQQQTGLTAEMSQLANQLRVDQIALNSLWATTEQMCSHTSIKLGQLPCSISRF